MSQPLSLDDVKELAENFAKSLLDDYIVELKTASSRRFSRKEINDALCGTIALTAIEVAILDSPLLQRQRYIRQLGVVHWVYPGAIHTRFDHALGVLYQVQQLTNALNLLGEQPQPLIRPHMVQLLRLSALLHDIGHPSFSHVSEIALNSLPELNRIPVDFSKKLRGETRKLSEIFAYFFVRSESMHDLMRFLLKNCPNSIIFDANPERNTEIVLELISNAIIGMRIDDSIPLLHELISGPFDADKLDYFVRDARLAGIPTVLDINRLVQKLALRDLTSGELPREIASQVRTSDNKHFIFGVKWSGVALLDELQLARVLLYAKIYRHPKVIAIEQMLRSVIITLGKVADIRLILTLLYSFPDDVLLNMSGRALADGLSLNYGDLELGKQQYLNQVATILSDIRKRRLWVRAFGLYKRKYPSDPLENGDAQIGGLIKALEAIEHPQQVEIFRQRVIDEIDNISKILGTAPDATKVTIDALVMIHALGRTPGSSQIDRAYLMPPSGKPFPYREYLVNRGAWADSYLSDQPAAFVFCPAQIADAAFIGVEKILRLEYGVILPASAIEVSKRDSSRISDMKARLQKGGYYVGVPYDIRPVPDRLLLADASQIIGNTASFLSRYQEPENSEIKSSNHVAPETRAFNWIRQFDDDECIECTLQVLEHFKMLTREDTITALKTFINSNPEFRGCRVIPFGSAKDSAAIITYFAADILGTFISECTTLAEAAQSRTKTPILFVDDFVGSGGQGSDILAAGFGLEELRHDLGEQRSMFGSAEQELLKSVKVGFAFTAAWDSGVEVIRQATDEVGIDAKVYAHIKESQIPFAFSGNVLEGIDSMTIMKFKERCENIGSQLLLSRGMDSEKVIQRKLGYGNRAMLLASPFNVPTQTLTAVWAAGPVDGIQWHPLMLRRQKR